MQQDSARAQRKQCLYSRHLAHAIKWTQRIRLCRSASVAPLEGGSGRQAASGGGPQFATVLMRAIISSTALSTGTFSLSTRFMVLAQTFSLLSTVNL